jgi:uncharacterized zinc-type alcohol dehydrogenase-like protein
MATDSSAQAVKTITTKCLACKDQSGQMIRHTFQRRAVGAADVHISISYSGICHSDIHTGKGEWGPQSYPLCVGHEILGKVVAVGSNVTKFKVGDVAGVGCFTDSCRTCHECKDGCENYCSGAGGFHGTYGSKRPEELHPGGVSQGGYSSDIVVDENYVIRVPEKMHKPATAPLLCAGITCYSPFRHFGLKPGMTLGVAGLGGLGHMGVKIGKAMGCEVVVLTRSEHKRESAMKLGASKVILTTDADQMKEAAKTMHMIYNSIAFTHDVKQYLGLLRTSGTMVMVGGIPDTLGVSSFDLLPRRLSIVGSCIGGIRETQEMIDFCAEHDIGSDIELVPATPEAVDTAWDRTIKADVNYRFVIDTAATLE